MNYTIIAIIAAVVTLFILIWLNSGAFDANKQKFKKSRQAKQKRLSLETDNKRGAKDHPVD